MPAMINALTLYCENATNQGAADTMPASAAPAPIVTSKAGRAQQISVLSDVNRLKDGASVCLYNLFSFIFALAIDVYNIVAGVGNDLGERSVVDVLILVHSNHYFAVI